MSVSKMIRVGSLGAGAAGETCVGMRRAAIRERRVAVGKNPKPEIRNPKEIRSPKSEKATNALKPIFRVSDFGLPSDFGFRISDFITAHFRSGNANATYASPLAVPILPPPHAITMYCRPRIMYVEGVA